jgi:hypothetical protein
MQRGYFFFFVHKVCENGIELVLHLGNIIVIIGFMILWSVIFIYSVTLSALNLVLKASYLFLYQFLRRFLITQIVLSLQQLLLVKLIIHFSINILSLRVFTRRYELLNDHILILIIIRIKWVLVLKRFLTMTIEIFLFLLELLLVW